MKILASDLILPGATEEKTNPLIREETAVAWQHSVQGSEKVELIRAVTNISS